jgi:hypothetical protein
MPHRAPDTDAMYQYTDQAALCQQQVQESMAEGGAFFGTQKVSTTVTLDEGGNSLTAQFQATYSSPDGRVLNEFSGTTEASRIRVEPR